MKLSLDRCLLVRAVTEAGARPAAAAAARKEPERSRRDGSCKATANEPASEARGIEREDSRSVAGSSSYLRT